jgi:hypothetical protein
VGTGTPHIEPGSPWGNCCSENFNGRLQKASVAVFFQYACRLIKPETMVIRIIRRSNMKLQFCR